jgi:uncharacterized protein
MIAQDATFGYMEQPGEAMRTILILLALALIVMIGKRLLQSTGQRGQRRERSGNMVQCARCGIYIPQHEALQCNGRNYCCAQHRDEDTA